MKKPDYPRGAVLTIGMMEEEDRKAIVAALSSSSDIQIVVDGKSYPVNTVAAVQFGMPSYNRRKKAREN